MDRHISSIQLSQWTEVMQTGQIKDKKSPRIDRNTSNVQLSQWTEIMQTKRSNGSDINNQYGYGYSGTGQNGQSSIAKNSPVSQLMQYTEGLKSSRNIDNKAESKNSGYAVGVSLTNGRDDDDYEEEFEAYDDEFEEDNEEKEEVTQSKYKVAEQLESNKPLKVDESKDKKKESNVNTNHHAYPFEPTTQKSAMKKIPDDDQTTEQHRPSNKKTPDIESNKKIERINIPIGPPLMADPRSYRIKRILDSGVMDLQIEKSTQLNILPSTSYELYHSMLHASDPIIKQVGVPGTLEKRDMEVNTDEIIMVDKEMQYFNDDDTVFYNIIKEIQRRKKAGPSTEPSSREPDSTGRRSNSRDPNDNQGPSPRPSKRNSSSSTTSTMKNTSKAPSVLDVVVGVNSSSKSRLSTEDHENPSTNRFSSFLTRSSHLIETILNEEFERKNNLQLDENERVLNKNSKDRGSGSGMDRISNIFEGDWIELGFDKTNGGNELLRTRNTLTVKFSALRPSHLLTIHPYPTADEDSEAEDLKPGKGLYGIWDSYYAPGGPSFVLEATGQPTCGCFSAAQPFIVVGGTVEGCIHLWDLREPNLLHKDRDSVDLRIEKGIRKPCFSTHFSSTSFQESDDDQHTGAVLQIEALDFDGQSGGSSQNAPSAVSQFVSVDESGTVIFWVTSQQGSILSLDSEYGLSPWGRTRLVATRKLQSNLAMYNHHLGSSSWAGSNGLFNKTGLSSNGMKSKTPGGGGTGSSSGTYGTKKNSLMGGSGNGSIMVGSVGIEPILLSTIADDSSTLLITSSEGSISKLARFGEPSPPITMNRTSTTKMNIIHSSSHTNYHRNTSYGGGGGGGGGSSGGLMSQEVRFYSPVTCIAVRPIANLSAESTSSSNKAVESSISSSGDASSIANRFVPLVLVGRMDGTLDLFQLDSNIPIQSWSLSNFINQNEDKKSNSKGNNNRMNPTASSSDPIQSIVFLRWCPSRLSVFFVVDSMGNIYAFDLLRDPQQPILLDSVEAMNLTIQSMDLSTAQHPRQSLQIAVTNAVFTSAVNQLTASCNSQKQSKTSRMTAISSSSARVRRLNKLWIDANHLNVKGAGGGGGEWDPTRRRDEMKLRNLLSLWSTNSTIAQVVAVYHKS